MTECPYLEGPASVIVDGARRAQQDMARDRRAIDGDVERRRHDDVRAQQMQLRLRARMQSFSCAPSGWPPTRRHRGTRNVAATGRPGRGRSEQPARHQASCNGRHQPAASTQLAAPRCEHCAISPCLVQYPVYFPGAVLVARRAAGCGISPSARWTAFQSVRMVGARCASSSI